MKAMTVGVIGAGQLGAFLCEAARNLGLKTIVLAQKPKDPAVALADEHIIGDLSDASAIKSLRERADVVTFEREDIGSDVLQELDNAAESDAYTVAPRPDILRLLQDKATQKQWLVTNGFPTAAFVDGDVCTREQAVQQFGLPMVQKAKRGGFDGRGVQILDEDSIDEYWTSGALVEECVSYTKELSALVARDASGNIALYPMIEAIAKPGEQVLDCALMPARISESHSKQALQMAADIVTKLEGVGLFAIEMFITADGTLLVNEISPRVHNTGHLTLQASETSQFTQHLRAVCGLGLGPSEQSVAALCKNVLHEDDGKYYEDGPFARREVEPGVWFHWYGKEQLGKGRKLGHISCTADSVEKAINLLETFQAPARHYDEIRHNKSRSGKVRAA